MHRFVKKGDGSKQNTLTESYLDWVFDHLFQTNGAGDGTDQLQS